MDKEALAKAAGAALASGALGRNLFFLSYCLLLTATCCVIVLLLLCCFVLEASGAAFASAGALGKTCYVLVLLLCCCDILLSLFCCVGLLLRRSPSLLVLLSHQQLLVETFYLTQVYLESDLWVQVSVRLSLSIRPFADLTDSTLAD